MRSRTIRSVKIGTAALLLLFVGAGAYAQNAHFVAESATLVRQTHTLRSPIRGEVVHELDNGAFFPKNAPLARIHDHWFEERPVELARLDLEAAEGDWKAKRDQQAQFEQALADRRVRAKAYSRQQAESLSMQLQAEEAQLQADEEAARHAESTAARQRQLVEQQVSSRAELEDADHELEQARAAVESRKSEIAYLTHARDAQSNGYNLLQLGLDEAMGLSENSSLTLRRIEAASAVREAARKRTHLELSLDAEQRHRDRMETATLTAPSDVLVDRVLSASGETIYSGAPIATLQVCATETVEVYVSRDTAAKLQVGQRAGFLPDDSWKRFPGAIRALIPEQGQRSANSEGPRSEPGVRIVIGLESPIQECGQHPLGRVVFLP